jgi:EmrB/QacA subfamily drug resistance transporter
MAGLALFTCASLAAALSRSDALLIAMRGLQGFGAAIVLPAALSIVMNMFAEGSERNKALGLWGAIGMAGATIGLIAGGLLTRYLGWDYIFFLNVPIGVVALALTPVLVPESRLQSASRRFDTLGAVTVTGGLLLLVYGLSKASQSGWGSTTTVVSLAVSAALLVAFLLVEARAEAPLMPLRIFRLRPVAAANAVGLLVGGSFYAFVFIGTLYMQQVLGYSALETGAAWLAGSVASALLAGVSQTLVTRLGPGPVMALGMALTGGGILWAGQAPVGAHYWTSLVAPFFVVGAGTAFAFIPISIAGLTGVTEREAGLASGLLNTSQQLGGAIGVAIASTVAVTHLKTLLGQGTPTKIALTDSFHWGLWVGGAIALLALPTIAVVLRRTATPASAGSVVPAPADDAVAAVEADSVR